MSEYSFDQYNTDTQFTRDSTDNKHLNSIYALLGLIGEVGEVAVNIDRQSLKDVSEFPELKPNDLAVVSLLAEFIEIAIKIEAFKKHIRKEQVPVLDGVSINNLFEEIGGVLWYLNTLAGLSDIKLSAISQDNVSMLEKRFDANPEWMTNGGIKTH